MSSRNFLKTTWDLSRSNHDNILLQYYMSSEETPPEEILIPEGTGFNTEVLQQWLNTQFSSRIKISTPQKGHKRLLVTMAEKNARLYMAQKIPPSAMEDLRDLQKVLNLPRLPETIEAFDISNLGESFTVAGMVQFKEGVSNKSGYRRYKIKSVDGQNDFAMMMEVVNRRISRLRDEGKPFPDLLLIDGGKGQLNAAIKALQLFENPPLVVSLAKKRKYFFPYTEEPVSLPANHPARRLVERIRDEVHRYAVTYHRKLRGKQYKRSRLGGSAGDWEEKGGSVAEEVRVDKADHGGGCGRDIQGGGDIKGEGRGSGREAEERVMDGTTVRQHDITNARASGDGLSFLFLTSWSEDSSQK